jgi:ribonucleoside-triphosphate reductase
MPTWGPTGREVYERTYAREKADGTLESWDETVARVVDGNLALVPEEHHLPGERDELFNLIREFAVIPAGRHLWTSGVPGRQFNRNCHRAGWGPSLSDHFTFTFDELMKGGGVGANYSAEYLQALPPVAGLVSVFFVLDADHPDHDEVRSIPGLNFTARAMEMFTGAPVFMVPDTREGWVDAMGWLIEQATEPGHHVVVFDLSAVRPRGTALAGFGGRASGPGPLASALATASAVLEDCHGRHLSGLEAMRLDHAIAQCVVAGNIRRSARMSIMHWKDPSIFEFIQCKADHSDHWTTNISVEVDEDFFLALNMGDAHAEAVFSQVVDAMLVNGEPGFFNSSLASVGERSDVRSTNPCGEIALEEWESCNLGHVNLAAFGADIWGAAEAFALMARFLIRATFADLTDERQAEVEARNRRIGVGFFGFQEWLGAFGLRFSEAPGDDRVAECLEMFRLAATLEADVYADELGIPRPVKHTTIAPTGSVAKLPGNTEGIHPVYSRYYERRVRYAANDPKLVELADAHEVEDCIYSADTKVVVFHVRDTVLDTVPEDMVEQADEVSAADMLAVQRLVQTHYADNAVSFTVNIDPETSHAELADALREHLPYLKGTTVMPDASRPQAPYTRITREAYEAATDHEVGQSFEECSLGACPVR